MKFEMTLLLILISFQICISQIALNIGVEISSDKAQKAVDFMNEYIKDFRDDFKVEYADYFTEKDCLRYKRPDLMAFSLIGNNPIYIMGDPILISLKEEHEKVQLKLLFSETDSTDKTSIYFISNHTVSFAEEDPHFMLPLHVNTKNWKQYRMRNITYHFPQDIQIDTMEAKAMMLQVEQLEVDWNLSPEEIDYYFADSNREIQQIRGFDYNFYMGGNESPRGLSDTRDNLVFCSGLGENYFHEVVHIYLNKKFPQSPLKEGIAVFYGGSVGESLNWHLKRLNEYLANNPEVDVLNAKAFYYIDEFTNPQYAIQGLLCALVFDQKGISGLQELMSYTSMEQIFQEVFEIEKGSENQFVRDKIKIAVNGK